eukprot:14546303-Heterocapsa_arctica.AAC.1
MFALMSTAFAGGYGHGRSERAVPTRLWFAGVVRPRVPRPFLSTITLMTALRCRTSRRRI